jgi:hypothetical protein
MRVSMTGSQNSTTPAIWVFRFAVEEFLCEYRWRRLGRPTCFPHPPAPASRSGLFLTALLQGKRLQQFEGVHGMSLAAKHPR